MAKASSAPKLLLAAIPLLIFGGLVGVFGYQLLSGRDTSELPSALIGRPVPTFDLPALPNLKAAGKAVPGLATTDLKGRVKLVNIFASWCAPCRAEHPVLMKLSEDTRFDVVGINYKDEPQNALRFLGALGNPFTNVGSDRKGRTAIEWGFYGIPETLLVDERGIIRHKVVGPISAEKYDVLKAQIDKVLEQ